MPSHLPLAMSALLLIASGPAVGCRPEPAHPDPAGAVERCERGLAALLDAPPDRRFLLAVDACQELFAEEGCREGWDALGEVAPDRRAAEAVPRLVERCRQAYCPKLPEPRPVLCERGEDLPQSVGEGLTNRAALFAAILHHDLGERPARTLPTRLAMLLDLARPITIPVTGGRVPAREEPEKKTAVVRLRLVDDAVRVSLEGAATGEWTLPISGSAADFAGLVEALGPEPARVEVAIVADTDLRYATIRDLLAALTTAGVERISFTTAP